MGHPQQHPWQVSKVLSLCAASPTCSREPWMSEVPAWLLTQQTCPKSRQAWSLSEPVTIGATLSSTSKWNSSALLHTSTAISHTLALGQVCKYWTSAAETYSMSLRLLLANTPLWGALPQLCLVLTQGTVSAVCLFDTIYTPRTMNCWSYLEFGEVMDT